MIKLFLLSKLLNSFIQITEPETLEHLTNTLQEGESSWVAGKLSDSYENEILFSIGLPVSGKSIDEYRKVFWELGLEVEHLEIKQEMVLFNGAEELRAWVKTQVGSELLTERYLAAMREKGWVDVGDGRIGFPTKQLLAHLKVKRQL